MSSGQCVNVQCSKGYHPNNEGQCTDIDECSVGNPCKRNQRCLNTMGSYRCINFLSCGAGHELNEAGTHCVASLYCSLLLRCNSFIISMFLIHCLRTCHDVDECQVFKDGRLCIGTCINEPGSYRCTCPDGYRLGSDGRSCQDIDECEIGNRCKPNEICIDTRGGYRCNSINCPPGYTRDKDHK
ncbi:hypothetical protein J437_LFUL008109, partial [Ladona fulva]